MLPNKLLQKPWVNMRSLREKMRNAKNGYIKTYGPGAVAQACNPSTLGGRDGWIMRSRDWDHPGQHGETPSLLKIQKISWAWWHVPVIPATREAEAGELPEPRRRRLRWAKIAPLHSSLGNKSETQSQKKKTHIPEKPVERKWRRRKCKRGVGEKWEEPETCNDKNPMKVWGYVADTL